jgi:hypothetical protein
MIHSEKYINQIKTNLHNWFYSIGYNKVSSEFIGFDRETEKYYEKISVSVEINNDMLLGAIPSFSRKIKLINNFWEEYKAYPLKTSGGIPYTFSGDLIANFLFDEKNRPKPIANWANWREAEPNMIEKICEKVKEDYYGLILPKLDEYSNIYKLDVIANGEDRTFSNTNTEQYFIKLVVAKLAGNPKYEEIYQEMNDMYKKIILDEPTDDYYKNNLWVIKKIYEKLKDVQPLENPILI